MGQYAMTSPEVTLPDFANGTYELAFNHYVTTEADYDGGNHSR